MLFIGFPLYCCFICDCLLWLHVLVDIINACLGLRDLCCADSDCLLQSLATQGPVGSTALRSVPGGHAHPCVDPVAQHRAMSHACTMVLQWMPPQMSSLRTACLWASPSAFSPALPPPVSPTCGARRPGATAPAASRTGLCPASVSRVARQMVRYVCYLICSYGCHFCSIYVTLLCWVMMLHVPLLLLSI